MLRRGEDLPCRAGLDDLAFLHDAEAIRNLADDAEVVRDEQVGEPELVLQRLPVLHGVVRRDEVVDRAVSHDDLAALGLELLQAHVTDVHDRCNDLDAFLILLRIERHGVELGITRDDELGGLIAGGIEQWFFA